MTWTDLSGAFGYGSVLTSTQMQNLRDNIAAAFAGDAGAPQLVLGALDTGDYSGNTTSTGNQTFTGGQYCFFPQVRETGNGNW